VGVDVVDAVVLAQRLEQQPGLADVLFTSRVRAASGVPGRALAACFAAKEAFVKALGRGLNATGPDAWLQEVEVEVDGDGLPRLRLGAAPRRALRRRGLAAPQLALARAGGFALATVLLLPEAQPTPGEDLRSPPSPGTPDERTRCP
jgi:phosphopantetheine--protein transferase-like protein